MTWETKAQELLERYLYAFSRRLPLKQRDDIARELRSQLLDRLEDESGSETIDQETVRRVLEQSGSPERLAMGYTQNQYLIGPGIFPLFRMVVLIVMLVVAVVSILSMTVAVATGSGLELFERIAGLFTSLLAALGSTTAVFFVIERLGPDTDWGNELYDSWDISDLPEVRRMGDVKLWEQVVTVIGSLVLIIGLNGFASRIGAYFQADGGWTFIPMLTEGFYDLLPFLSFRWALSILLAGLLLYRKREGLFEALFAIILHALDLAIAIFILDKGVETFCDFQALSSTALAPLTGLLRSLLVAVFVIAIIASAVDIFKKIRQIYKFPSNIEYMDKE